MSSASKTSTSSILTKTAPSTLETGNWYYPNFAGAKVYGPDDLRDFRIKAQSAIVWICSIFFAVLIVSLFWICIRRDIKPRFGTIKYKERQKYRQRTREEFHIRVLQMMEENRLKEEVERIEKQKDETYKKNVEKFLKNVEEGRKEAVRARLEASLKKETEKADLLTEEPAILNAMRNMMEAGEKVQAERERLREQRKMEKKKERVIASEDRKRLKLEKKMASKAMKEERRELFRQFKEAWKESAAAVRKKEAQRDQPIPRKQLMKRRRYVPPLY
ncbi:hypothetical protein TWF506_005696 [Arthrobotrys conoides]|uniref:Uncharacterized protein n=1 Tax=Arthrobotrys conoides TaxID=74498 RepID=A0AAN8RW61_9PEZI